jgi:FkbM family methyltransferase
MTASTGELAPSALSERDGCFGRLSARLAERGATELGLLQVVDDAPLTATEKLAAAGHLRAVFSDEPGARSFLADADAVSRAVKRRRTLASSLLLCLDMGRSIPGSLKHAFGVFTKAHAEALAGALRSGEVSEDDLTLLAFNGDLIGVALNHPCIPTPLNFETSLGSTRRAHPARRPSTLQVDARGARFEIITSNGYELWRATNFAVLEPETLGWLTAGLEHGGLLVDVGANIGIFSLWAAAFAPSATVIAVEPEPQNFARLSENVALNGLTNVTAYPLALGDREGLARFSSRDPIPGAAAPFALSESSAAIHVSGCVVQTLDWLIENVGAGPPSQIKIDVDGDQLAVLRGASRTLANPEVRSVLVELFDDEAAQVDSLMSYAGLIPAGVWAHTSPIGDRGRVANRIYERRGR